MDFYSASKLNDFDDNLPVDALSQKNCRWIACFLHSHRPTTEERQCFVVAENDTLPPWYQNATTRVGTGEIQMVDVR